MVGVVAEGCSDGLVNLDHHETDGTGVFLAGAFDLDCRDHAVEVLYIVGSVATLVVAPPVGEPPPEDEHDGAHEQKGADEGNYRHHDIIKDVDFDDYPF